PSPWPLLGAAEQVPLVHVEEHPKVGRDVGVDRSTDLVLAPRANAGQYVEGQGDEVLRLQVVDLAQQVGPGGRVQRLIALLHQVGGLLVAPVVPVAATEV